MIAPNVGEQLLLSVVEHFAYCPRQAALIHVDAEWVPNSLTAQGTADHAIVDAATRHVSKDGVQSWLSLPVWSDELGIYGVCDVVEFSPAGPVPVEYKPSLTRSTQSPAAQQITAQAMCLEEMFDVVIDTGFIFTRKDRRRHRVELDNGLRDRTLETIRSASEMIARRALPPGVNDRRCEKCSLAPVCRPQDRRPQAEALFAVAAEGSR